MKLKDTVKLMKSDDFKDRFKAEYYQLKNRICGLDNMLNKMENGELPFTPKCSYGVLRTQLQIMWAYKAVLEERARIEGIELDTTIHSA